ncbi:MULTISPECIES: TetR/AcrR family transcriptional regulator [unclassified Crossiella]|uniref:TetR/AcrR family transcriptional regulator n=1 Tax=unclassified Crossiella TaxID=2620835 RepID=UPI001FFEA3B1|nr:MULTISPECIES: TetR/AcrR family transcriptional regulator [unclassified Crossiella]MCK2241458.1 TetR/AcrR family transcriptional regulator [Crossiella sp. S99.2]MCK2255670.1 TetR/AcrR family transcriptional regulator [Crossiella sp. S99.1]
MTEKRRGSSVTRDRLLLAAGQLLHDSPDGKVSTRAICERAGVQAPTLYHHFGSKQGLLDSVADYGLSQYLDEEPVPEGDPVAALRRGWDNHVRFGLDHPGFYVLLYGQVEPGAPCALTGAAEAMLLELLRRIAQQGRLRVTPAEAARQIVAANVGVALSLIAQPEPTRDLGLSDRLRDNVIDALLTDAPAAAGEATVPTAAVALLAALDGDPAGLSDGEAQLLREWLRRLAG